MVHHASTILTQEREDWRAGQSIQLSLPKKEMQPLWISLCWSRLDKIEVVLTRRLWSRQYGSQYSSQPQTSRDVVVKCQMVTFEGALLLALSALQQERSRGDLVFETDLWDSWFPNSITGSLRWSKCASSSSDLLRRNDHDFCCDYDSTAAGFSWQLASLGCNHGNSQTWGCYVTWLWRP